MAYLRKIAPGRGGRGSNPKSHPSRRAQRPASTIDSNLGPVSRKSHDAPKFAGSEPGTKPIREPDPDAQPVTEPEREKICPEVTSNAVAVFTEPTRIRSTRLANAVRGDGRSRHPFARRSPALR